MRTLTLAFLAIGFVACGSGADPEAAAAQQTGALTTRQAQLRASAEVLFELREAVNPYANQATTPRLSEVSIKTGCEGVVLGPRPSFAVEHKGRIDDDADLRDKDGRKLSYYETRMAELHLEGEELALRGVALGRATNKVFDLSAFNERIDRLAAATINVAILRLETANRRNQEGIKAAAKLRIGYDNCRTREFQQALDTAEISRNQAMTEFVASGAASRLLAAADIQSLLASRATYQRLFDSAVAEYAESSKATAHLREVVKQVETPELLKSRNDLVRTLRTAR